jgi:hypothetical protein
MPLASSSRVGVSDPAERVARSIVLLRAENQVGVAEVRDMGRIAKEFGVEREDSEPYDQFLARLLEEVTK